MITELIPEFQPFADDLIQAASAARLNPRVTSTRRTHAEQKRLYEKYLQGQSRFPAKPPGQSAHEFGYAFDMVVSPFEALGNVGYFWQQMGGVWGGSQDPVHFEYPGFVPPAEDLRDSTANADCQWWQYFWTPECKCKLVDARFGSMSAALAEIGFPQSEILKILASPCSEILSTLRSYGYPF